MSLLDELREKYKEGIPVKDPERVAELVREKASHLPEGALDAHVEALIDATAANDREKQILAILAMLATAGLEIAIPG